MAVPKRKTSKARKNKRRSHLALTLGGSHVCPQCKERTRPHAVCASCGFYKGKQVIALQVD